jgi:hypothetical protein
MDISYHYQVNTSIYFALGHVSTSHFFLKAARFQKYISYLYDAGVA